MANVIFKRGEHQYLPTSGAIEGAFYLTTDSDRLYVGKADGTLADLNKYVKLIDSLADGATLPEGREGDFLYIKDSNILAVHTNGAWKQVNPDTDTNTTYDLKAEAGTKKAIVKLGAKNIGDASFSYTDKFAIVGTGTAEVSYTNNEIVINVPATDLTNYYTKSEVYTQKEVDDKLDLKADKSYVGTFTASEGVDTVVKYIDAKTANIASDERVNGIDNRVKTIEGDYLKSTDKTELEGKINNKADSSVVEAMYTNTKIDELIQEAKNYADNNDADTQYGIEYDSINKVIKLVSDTSKTEIDATDFIKDGMIQSVELEDNNLIITWNTDAEKGDETVTTIPLSGLVDIYTGVDGTTIKVEVSDDDKISAEIKEGTVAKSYLTTDVQTSLGLADSAVQPGVLTSTLNDYYTKTDADAEFMNAGEVEAKITELKLDTMSQKSANDYYTSAQVDDAIDADVKTAIDAEVLRANGAYEPIGAEDRATTYTNTALESYDLSTEVDQKIADAIEAGLIWGTFQ